MTTKIWTNLDPVDRRRLQRLLAIVVEVLTNEHADARVGATFNIRNEKRHVLYDERAGRAVEDLACCYDFYAGEKTFRLVGFPDHVLSWQSSDPANGRYAGGVRFPNGLVAALSGYKAEEDEAATLWIGVKMDWWTKTDATNAASISKNPRYFELFQKFDRLEKSAA